MLQLGRGDPALTIVIDTPQRIAESFTIIDELTTDGGLVTSEIPALRATTEEQHSGGIRLANFGF